MTYVAALNDIRNPQFFATGGLGVAEPSGRITLGGDAARGRELFFDAYKGVQRCATCHEVEGLGIPVAATITTVPASIDALRQLKTPRVQRITADGETMPGLMISNSVAGARFFDLTTAPPVLRTLRPGEQPVTTTENEWSHRTFLQGYDDGELQMVLQYLTEIIR